MLAVIPREVGIAIGVRLRKADASREQADRQKAADHSKILNGERFACRGIHVSFPGGL
jgi:hypothetical protein